MTRAAPTFCVVCRDGPAVGVVAGDRGKGEPVVPGYVASEPPADMSTPGPVKLSSPGLLFMLLLGFIVSGVALLRSCQWI